MIQATGLTKRYGGHTAVDNVSFTVDDGEILGFLGPNGAGKTTTLNMLTGYISATEGDIIINGCDMLAQPEKAKKHLGYLPDTPPVYGEMLVDEYLCFVADLKGVKKSGRAEMLREIKQTVQIENESRRLIRNLSKGYRQRIGLAQALVGYPDVIIMDEPTVGLDPKQIIEMRELIKNLKGKHTVILSSHILSEVSAICDRVMIMNKGCVVAVGTPEQLSRGLSHSHNMQARIKGSREDIEAAFAGTDFVQSLTFEAEREEGTYDVAICGLEDTDIREPVFYRLAQANLPLLMLKSRDLTLEEIFLTVTEVAVESPREKNEAPEGQTEREEQTEGDDAL